MVADAVDLNFNYPTLPGQADHLRRALRELAGSGDLEALLRYQPHGGRERDRAAVATHLLSRGLDATPDCIAIVNGAQHGLTVVALAMLRPGDVVAADAITYPGFKVIAESLNLELAPIPTTLTGPDLTALESLCQRRPVRAIYTMPTLHNPLGWVMDERARQRLTAVARRHRLLIVEDGDEYTEFARLFLGADLAIRQARSLTETLRILSTEEITALLQAERAPRDRRAPGNPRAELRSPGIACCFRPGDARAGWRGGRYGSPMRSLSVRRVVGWLVLLAACGGSEGAEDSEVSFGPGATMDGTTQSAATTTTGGVPTTGADPTTGTGAASTSGTSTGPDTSSSGSTSTSTGAVDETTTTSGSTGDRLLGTSGSKRVPTGAGTCTCVAGLRVLTKNSSCVVARCAGSERVNTTVEPSTEAA